VPVRAVYFDAAGTLLHPARPVGHTYAAIAREFGAAADPGLIHEAFKAAWKSMRAEALRREGRAPDSQEWWKEVVRRTWSAAPLPGGFPFDAYYARLYDAFADPGLWSIFPEVRGLLATLKEKGLRCGVLSNWDARLRPVLLGHSLSFDAVVISGEVGWEKPSREIFRIAEKALDVRPEEALLVGDDPVLDGEGARAAGWRACLVGRPAETLEKALALLEG
jgi:putative hydrolase of the HAD superfamily